MSSRVVTLRAEDALVEALDEWAAAQGVTRSEAAASLLRASLWGDAREAVIAGATARLYGELRRRLPALYQRIQEAVRAELP